MKLNKITKKQAGDINFAKEYINNFLYNKSDHKNSLNILYFKNSLTENFNLMNPETLHSIFYDISNQDIIILIFEVMLERHKSFYSLSDSNKKLYTINYDNIISINTICEYGDNYQQRYVDAEKIIIDDLELIVSKLNIVQKEIKKNNKKNFLSGEGNLNLVYLNYFIKTFIYFNRIMSEIKNPIDRLKFIEGDIVFKNIFDKISENPRLSFLLIKNVIRWRWPKAEKNIVGSYYNSPYMDYLNKLKGRI